jgi:hypothetical protein
MMKLLRLGIVMLLTLSFLGFAPHTSAQVDPLKAACDSDAVATVESNSPTCNRSTTNTLTGESGLLFKVARVISIIAGAAAVIVLILGGIKYINSGGDAQKVASAKTTIIGAAVGLLIITLAQVIITFVVKGVLK